jgi:hypothetical protein
MSQFAASFIGIPEQWLPSDRSNLADALMAEAVRVRFSVEQHFDNPWGLVHILSLKNWTKRKLRGVLPELLDDSNNHINRILYEGPGPNLEFIGDTISLGSGYYAKTPTRVVPINNATYLLLSGFPTEVFEKLGFTVTLNGLVRWLIDADSSQLDSCGIPTQEKRSYL